MNAPPRTRRLTADPDLDLLALHALAPARWPFLLESASVAEGHARSRWSLAAGGPGQRLVLHPDGRLEGPCAEACGFLAALDAWVAAIGPAPTVPEAAGLPFVGGWFLYLGYELAGEVEPRLRLPVGPAGQPVAVAERIDRVVLVDRATGAAWLVVEDGDALDRLQHELAAARAHGVPRGAFAPPVLAEDPPERYLDAVERALAHVAAGDVYQANLARAWRGRVAPGTDAVELYARLRAANPGPFAGLARLPGFTVLSTSPERLVECRDGRVETRPIAGTRARGTGDERATIAELRAHPKERAEHVMLIDLERNDLGRLCVAGSVRVDEWMAVESYAHVHHLVSNVSGTLRADATPGAVIRALFPGGTITGCPKVRCMELIAALEGEARGAYTGSIGYLGRDGALDLNILIRTATLAGDRLELRAGAGIVADSDPWRELEETRAKARGLLRGLGAATA